MVIFNDLYLLKNLWISYVLLISYFIYIYKYEYDKVVLSVLFLIWFICKVYIFNIYVNRIVWKIFYICI